MTPSLATRRTLALALTIIAACSSTPAATSFDFLFSMNSVSNDDQLFLNLTVSNYGYPRRVLEPVLPRIRYVETDLPVILFLARQSGRPVDFIVGLRSRGLGWSTIFTKVGVPHEVLFVGIDRNPGPPYGNAWGYWKKNPRKVRLADADIVGLVQVQVAHRVVGISPFEAARARGSAPIGSIVADKKGRPFQAASTRPGPPGHAAKPSHGKGRGPH